MYTKLNILLMIMIKKSVFYILAVSTAQTHAESAISFTGTKTNAVESMVDGGDMPARNPPEACRTRA